MRHEFSDPLVPGSQFYVERTELELGSNAYPMALMEEILKLAGEVAMYKNCRASLAELNPKLDRLAADKLQLLAQIEQLKLQLSEEVARGRNYCLELLDKQERIKELEEVTGILETAGKMADMQISSRDRRIEELEAEVAARNDAEQFHAEHLMREYLRGKLPPNEQLSPEGGEVWLQELPVIPIVADAPAIAAYLGGKFAPNEQLAPEPSLVEEDTVPVRQMEIERREGER